MLGLGLSLTDLRKILPPPPFDLDERVTMTGETRLTESGDTRQTTE